jgi:hypothetical protein
MDIGKLAAVCAVTLALSACQQEQASQQNAAANTVDTAAPPAAQGGGTLWNGGAAKPLDLQVAHPNGTVLQLTSLQSRPTDTAVGVRVINGRERDVDLNRFNSNRDGYLLLDTGERLYLSPPATNTKLTIPANQTFEGELVFLGRLPAVRTAILVLNENSSDSEYTTTPQFRVDLPLTAAAGAAQ